MRSRYKIAELEAPHFITCTIVGWLPVFTRQKYIDVIIASLRFCQWLLKQFEFFKSVHKSKSQHQVWQEGFHPQAITAEDMLRQKLEYIHYNPVRIGLVDRPEDWRYSSARNYLGQDGVLEIDSVEL